jgi:hypothetical protein
MRHFVLIALVLGGCGGGGGDPTESDAALCYPEPVVACDEGPGMPLPGGSMDEGEGEWMLELALVSEQGVAGACSSTINLQLCLTDSDVLVRADNADCGSAPAGFIARSRDAIHLGVTQIPMCGSDGILLCQFVMVFEADGSAAYVQMAYVQSCNGCVGLYRAEPAGSRIATDCPSFP